MSGDVLHKARREEQEARNPPQSPQRLDWDERPSGHDMVRRSATGSSSKGACSLNTLLGLLEAVLLGRSMTSLVGTI